jgi:hypothetical protein
MINPPQANRTFTASESETQFFPRFHPYRLEATERFASSSHSFPQMKRLQRKLQAVLGHLLDNSLNDDAGSTTHVTLSAE